MDEYTSLIENNKSHGKNYRSSMIDNSTPDTHEVKAPEISTLSILVCF